MTTSEAIDPDGNVFRPGMAILSHGERWTVSRISRAGRNQLLVADRYLPDGRKSRLLVGRSRLRFVHIIGFQAPRITYP